MPPQIVQIRFLNRDRTLNMANFGCHVFEIKKTKKPAELNLLEQSSFSFFWRYICYVNSFLLLFFQLIIKRSLFCLSD
jgi:hypothetical protein